MNSNRYMGRTGFVLALASFVLTGGCSASKGKVTLRGDENRTLYAQSFDQAWITASHDGEYDVILIQDAATNAPKKDGLSSLWPPQLPGLTKKNDNKPLQPLEASTLRQIVHIHVFWQAAGGSVAKDGVVTNAAIDWYVLNHESTDHPELLHYQGAGYVVLDEGKKSTSVDIRDGSMRKNAVRGDLKDPVGPAQLKGTVKAQRNSQLVRDTIADLKAQTATARTTVSQAR
jgi:hypothetical protein